MLKMCSILMAKFSNLHFKNQLRSSFSQNDSVFISDVHICHTFKERRCDSDIKCKIIIILIRHHYYHKSDPPDKYYLYVDIEICNKKTYHTHQTTQTAIRTPNSSL